jgi:hypothetical protein
VEKLQVDVAAVQVMAGRWQAQAADLGAGATPGLGLSCQASAAAVNTAHAETAVTTAAMTRRVQTTAAKVAAADTGYVANEANSAAKLAVTVPPTVV